MRSVVIGALLGAGLAILVLGRGSYPTAAVAGPLQQQATDGLLAFSAAAEGAELLTVVDTESRVIAAYQIDHKTGGLALKSVRNINWDLQMLEFNGAEPHPHEIRAQLEQR